MSHDINHDDFHRQLVSIGEASRLLGVCADTLREWDKLGTLKPIRTAGGHRRYRLEDLKRIQEEGFKPREPSPKGEQWASAPAADRHP